MPCYLSTFLSTLEQIRGIQFQPRGGATQARIFLIVVSLSSHLDQGTRSTKAHTEPIFHPRAYLGAFRVDIGFNLVSFSQRPAHLTAHNHEYHKEIEQAQKLTQPREPLSNDQDCDVAQDDTIKRETGFLLRFRLLSLPRETESRQDLRHQDGRATKSHPEGGLGEYVTAGTDRIAPSTHRSFECRVQAAALFAEGTRRRA